MIKAPPSTTESAPNNGRVPRSAPARHLVLGDGVDGPGVEYRANDRLLDRVTSTELLYLLWDTPALAGDTLKALAPVGTNRTSIRPASAAVSTSPKLADARPVPRASR